MPQPKYPTVLKRSDWNVKKGAVARLTKGDTGIGQLLNGLEAYFNDVEWQYWYPEAKGKLPEIKTEAQLNERISAAKTKRVQLTSLAGMIENVSAKCATVGGQWEKSLVVPATTAKHVKVKMVAALDQLADEVKQVEGEYTKTAAKVKGK
jgi:hypothetical protein